MSIRKTFFSLFAIGFFGSLAPHAHAGLIARWDFEEGSGGTAFNSTANAGLNGAISNAAYTSDAAVGNHALRFNGFNSFVQVANNSLLAPSSLGISLWFKANPGQVASADIIDKGHGLGSTPYWGGYTFQYRNNTNTIDAIYGNNSKFVGVNTGGNPAFNSQHHITAGNSGVNGKDGEWHHLVANLGAADVELFLDGVLLDSYSSMGPIVQNNSDLFFGRHRHPGLGRYFNGLIDDIRFYDGPLSQSEVTQLFRREPVAAPEPVSLALWSMLGAVGCGYVRRRRRVGG